MGDVGDRNMGIDIPNLTLNGSHQVILLTKI
jgi:hypothetical protein